MFVNHPPTDFSIPSNRDAYHSALSDIEQEIRKGLVAGPIVGGKILDTKEQIPSVDPSHPEQTIGMVGLASEDQALAALLELKLAWPNWRARPVTERCEIIHRAGQLISENKPRLSALMIREAAKPWKEAGADVDEAIDFCHYYATEVKPLSTPRQISSVLGEDNQYWYEPRGVAVVISPWNFPLAITCGMTVAALVCGNTVALKPSSQTALIAAEFVKILIQAGVPADAISLIPGAGGLIGSALVESPLTNLICFTGSKQVGVDILKRAAIIQPGQTHIKRVICELGGKNAIIVDEDADLDEAIKGILYSAFGYAGQKCSACSRVIAVGTAYELLLQRLCDAAADLICGPAAEPATFVNAVIDAASQTRICQAIKLAEQHCTLAFKGTTPKQGWHVPVTIFKDVPVSAPLWREELFGPVLACAPTKDFDTALNMANDNEYALTGGLFSRSPEHIAQARHTFNVGNLYINRGCTGAIVGRQPFGGFKLSGVGSKAGGPDYLLQFMEPRSVSENTMRRGFTPELLDPLDSIVP